MRDRERVVKFRVIRRQLPVCKEKRAHGPSQ